MDSSYEDKIYRQVEKSISNNVNDKLLVPIEIIDNSTYDDSNDIRIVDAVEPKLSRAEYILQAREACLRQMNTLNTTSRISNLYVDDEGSAFSSYERKKRSKVERLFDEGSDEENLPGEIASYRSLVIRTVCAVVIFISIFIIDKIKLSWGTFSYESIREYVTSNNQLRALEEIIVSWLK